MRATDTFRNAHGDIYEVTCEFYDSYGTRGWTVRVSKKPKGKRKFIPLVDDDSWELRKLEPKARDAYRYREYIKEIPWSWVESVMDDVVTEIRNLCCEAFPKD